MYKFLSQIVLINLIILEYPLILEKNISPHTDRDHLMTSH